MDLTLRAFVPIFESFPKIIGGAIRQQIGPDWRASQAEAVKSMCEGREKYAVLVAEVTGEAVGFLVYDLDEKTKTGTVQLIAVHPDYQNRGVGTELSEAAANEMRERGRTPARVRDRGRCVPRSSAESLREGRIHGPASPPLLQDPRGLIGDRGGSVLGVLGGWTRDARRTGTVPASATWTK